MIERDKCVVCNHANLNSLYSFDKFPIYMSVYNKSSENLNIKEDMVWANCDKCGCLQLKYLVEPSILYAKPHNPSLGKTWEIHNIEFSNFIKNYKLRNVIEIGGANLKLASLLVDESIEKYNVVDFSSGRYEHTKINEKLSLTVSSFEEYNFQEKVDSIILSHTFEHFYEPGKFLKLLYDKIDFDCRIYISVPNIENQLKDNFLNALNFEHTFYINENYIQILCDIYGFIIEEKKHFSKYNFFLVLKKDFKKTLKILQYSDEPSLVFSNFIENNKKDISKLNLLVKGKEYYIFGAHIFTQFLFYFGLKKENLSGILDNDPNKINNILCGIDSRVYSPFILENKKNPIIILRASQYTQEIKEQLLNINLNCIII